MKILRYLFLCLFIFLICSCIRTNQDNCPICYTLNFEYFPTNKQDNEFVNTTNALYLYVFNNSGTLYKQIVVPIKDIKNGEYNLYLHKGAYTLMALANATATNKGVAAIKVEDLFATILPQNNTPILFGGAGYNYKPQQPQNKYI